MKSNDLGIVDFELPDGTGVSVWASSDLRVSPWTFFWAEFFAPETPTVWYRVFAAGNSPGEWLPMEPADCVLSRTGFAADPDLLADPDAGGAQLGAAQKLSR